MGKGNDLGNDKIFPLVLKLAVPSMLAQLVNVLYGIVDRIYIGHIPQVGALALAGVGVCGPIATLISSFSALVGLGGGPLVAMRLGEGNRDGAEAIISNCLVMLLALSAALTLGFLAFKDGLLNAFGASEALFPYANQYLTWYAAGTVFAILSVGLNQFIICQGFSTAGMLTVVIGAVINIVLDPVFIFTMNLGVAGAAMATVLSQAVSTGFVVAFLLSRRVHARLRLGGYSLRLMRRVLSFGLSPFLIIATDSVVIIALNSALQRYGGPQDGDVLITCATIMQSYMQLITMPMGGLTGGTQPVLSFNYGARKVARILQGEKCILALCVGFTALMFAVSQVAPHGFVRIFTQDEAIVSRSVWAIRVYTACIIPLAFQYTFVDGLTALGIARVAVTLSLFRKLSMLVLTLVLPAFFGAEGALFAEPIADVMGCIASTTVFRLLIGRVLDRRMQMPEDMPLYS